MFAYLDHIRHLSHITDRIASGGKPLTQELADEIGVDYRQAARYIRVLRDLGAPLPISPRNHGYRFARRWDFFKALERWVRDTS